MPPTVSNYTNIQIQKITDLSRDIMKPIQGIYNRDNI